MGVPVVTCPGETFAAGTRLATCRNVGLTETIARDLDEYVELAVALASDLPRLAVLRAACGSGWLPRPLRREAICGQPGVDVARRVGTAGRKWQRSLKHWPIGLQHHQAGRLQAAEQIYRQILAVEPNHADAIHLLGVIAHQVRQDHAIAVEYIDGRSELKRTCGCLP